MNFLELDEIIEQIYNRELWIENVSIKEPHIMKYILKYLYPNDKSTCHSNSNFYYQRQGFKNEWQSSQINKNKINRIQSSYLYKMMTQNDIDHFNFLEF